MAALNSTRPYRRGAPPSLPDEGRYVAYELKRIEEAFGSITDSGNLIGFPSKAAAEAKAIPSGRSSLVLTGYYALGDAPLAVYKRVAAQPSHTGRLRTTDRLLPSGATDNTNGGWWELADTEIDIRTLGAYSDGAHAAEDTAALLACRQIMEARGAVMVLPKGTTLCSDASALWFHSGSHRVHGYGTESILKPTNGAALSTLIILDNPASLTLDNFVIDGNRANTGLHSTTSYCILIQSSGSFTCRRMEFRLINRIAVENFGTGPSKFVTFEHCHFHDIGQPVDVGNNIGVCINGGGFNNLRVSDCLFENIYPLVGPLSDVAAMNVTGTNINIERNTFIDILNVAGGMFSVSDASTGGGFLRTTIAHNHLEQTKRFTDVDPLSSNTDQQSGIEVNGSFVTIASNTIMGCSQNGIVVEGTASITVTITGNVIHGVGNAHVNAIQSPAELLVSSNIFRGGQYGMSLQGSGANVVFSNNTLVAVTTTSVGAKIIKHGNIGGDNRMAVSDLPSAGSCPGMRLQVSDATATTYGSVVAGGGANTVSLFSNGANWLIN
jgi:hypothetical protein